MARIIVYPDGSPATIVLSEEVKPVHLEDERSSMQFIERLAWAVQDAAEREAVAS